MRNLKILFITLGILSSLVVLIWSGKTRGLKESGINYVHNVVYNDPVLVSRTGAIVLKNTIRTEAVQTGNKYFVRVYDTVIAGGKENTVFAVVVHENKEWRLWSFSLIGREKSEEFVNYGQFNAEVEKSIKAF